MEYITVVRVLVRESRRPLRNVKVELFDRDELSPDDSLGLAYTNQFGDASFKYSTRDFADNPLGTDDQPVAAVQRDTVPDLYPVIYNRSDEIVVDMRDEATRNEARLHILFLIDEAVAVANHLDDVLSEND
jgi:hypothetical protein